MASLPFGFSLKFLLLALLVGLAPLASGSALRIETVSLPLYLHGSESDPEISIEKVPFVSFHADPEWRFAAISKPFVPSTDDSWVRHDVNLTSLYGIVVDGGYKANDKDLLVKIDASKAVLPEGYPFSIEQVIDAVVTCVKLMHPTRPADEGVMEIVITRPAKKPKVSK